MGKKKKENLLPKFEIGLLLIFVLTFFIWVVPKCGNNKELLPDHQAEEIAQPDSLPPQAANPAHLSDSSKTLLTEPQPQFTRYTKLYVIIDGLNVRTKPGLRSSIIDRLPLHSEVFFLNEVTDSTQQINLGDRIANEPWIKIKTPKGRTGWVYGAGVNYYLK